MNAFDWLFRNRETGEITIAQSPNAPAKVMVVSAIVGWLFPDDAVGKFARVVSVGSFTIWALQEFFAGVNPSRRISGFGALALQLRTLLR